ncbi:50S ribosomal protein L3 [Patescibacteria group bacterium AH-259-L05]|nr:50S ribosomal protein L3 [Patescibacteria group bacterium AH-259-L05]
MAFILGKKVEMSQKFVDDIVIPVTIIQAGPCLVTQIRTKDPRKVSTIQRGRKDGYNAIQIGFEKLDIRKVKKPQKSKPFRYLREFQGDISKYKAGDKIDVDVFKKGDTVDISGVSKGRGFQGVVKRWGFHGADASHGTKDQERMPGSIGATGPARVFRGKKMPGRMGGKRKTIKNLEVIDVDAKENLLFVKGAVPGARNSLLEIKSV